jgi:uncharacterized protein YfaP (DUF2135 family)
VATKVPSPEPYLVGYLLSGVEGKKEVQDYRVNVQTLSPKVASILGWEEVMGRGGLRLAAMQKKKQHAWSPDDLQQNHETYNATTPIRQAGRQAGR